MTAGLHAAAPIGIFDSGVGGLSVLRALQAQLPHERFLYYADTAHCPYGERDVATIRARAEAISAELIAAGAKLIVVACNTATIAAIAICAPVSSCPSWAWSPASNRR